LIVEALFENTKLESLFMNENNIDDDGAISIGKFIGNGKQSLKELHIARNSIA
jgi:hypothetical protein